MNLVTDQPINFCPFCKQGGTLERLEIISKHIRKGLRCKSCGEHMHWGNLEHEYLEGIIDNYRQQTKDVVKGRRDHMPEFEDKVRIEDAEAIRDTGKALIVVIDEEEYVIPQSQIDDDSEVYKVGQKGTLIISAWIAGKKGLA